MSLKTLIQDDMKSAMRARETARLSAIRLLLAAMKQREIDERIELDDNGTISIVEKLVKQRRDSASQYEAANRPELAASERFEIEVLSAYLPTALSSDEIDAEILSALQVTSATSIADMGKAMAALKSRLAGKADMAEVSRRLRAKLSA